MPATSLGHRARSPRGWLAAWALVLVLMVLLEALVCHLLLVLLQSQTSVDMRHVRHMCCCIRVVPVVRLPCCCFRMYPSLP